VACVRTLNPCDNRSEMHAVLAYLDAASGSLILQALAGGFAAVAVVAKLYWRRLLRMLRIRRPEDEVPTS
jgi:hypothetical protein